MCLYFHGKILYNNTLISGNFEYFINKHQMLFHRFFKQDKIICDTYNSLNLVHYETL